MKQLHKKLACALLAVCTLSSGLIAGCAPQKNDGQTQLIITPAQSDVRYSQMAKNQAVDAFVTTCANVLTQLVGTPPTERNLFRLTANDIVAAFEARGVPERDMLSAFSIVVQEEQLLARVLSEKTLSLQDGARLYSELASLCGADLAARLISDFSQIYCTYWVNSYTKMYYETPLPFIQAKIDEWETKREGFGAVGEENFSRLLRLLVSASGLLRGETGTLPVGNGEVALFVRAQGALLQGLDMSVQNWEFLFSILSEQELVWAQMLVQSGASKQITAHASTLTQLLASSLSVCTFEWASELAEGKLWEFLHSLCSVWTQEDWQKMENALLAHQEQDYLSYLVAIGQEESYNAFLATQSTFTLSDLRGAEKGQFGAVFQGYVFGVSPALCYMVFK